MNNDNLKSQHSWVGDDVADWAKPYAALKGSLEKPPDRREIFSLMDNAYVALVGALGRIKKLETQLAEIETRGVEYKGVHQRALPYKRGSLVTHHGSMFAALRDVAINEIPGESDAWQLAVKRGQDARSTGVVA